MQELHLNLWAVLGAGVAKFFIGFLWHEVNPYAKKMLPLMGTTYQAMKKKRPKALPVEFLVGLLMAWILAHAIRYAGAQGISQAMMVAFFNWLGFVATVQIAEVVWHDRPMKWFYFSGGFCLGSLLVICSRLAPRAYIPASLVMFRNE